MELGASKKLFLPTLPSLLLIETKALDCSHQAKMRSPWTKSVRVKWHVLRVSSYGAQSVAVTQEEVNTHFLSVVEIH